MEEFQYLYGINGGEQLYFESNTWYQTKSKKFKFCPSVATISDGEEDAFQNVKILLCPLNSVMLRSDHIMQAIEILKLQFEHIGGLVDTLIFSSDPSRPIELNLKQRNVFILHTPNLAHWVVITNINHNDEGKWLFLDSLNHISYLKSFRNSIIQICTNNTSSKNRIEVYSVNMAQQIGTYDW